MEKLIQYLNEYEDGMVSWVKEYVEEFGVFVLNTEQMIEEEIIISKSFGFIKWLVDNDKIDRTYREDLKYPYYIDDKERDLKGYEKSDLLVMLCSIQDNPIEFLCEILK